MPSADQLERMRARPNGTMVDTCVVQRPTSATGPLRERVPGNPLTVYEGACRVAPRSASPYDRIVADRLITTSFWVVTLPARTNVHNDDRIITTSAHGSQTLEVIASAGPKTNELSWRVECVKRA